MSPATDMRGGGALRATSYIRPLKLFTASPKVIRSTIGQLAWEKVDAVAALIIAEINS